MGTFSTRGGVKIEISGERIILRDDPKESDNRVFFRWRNLQEWQYWDDPWTPFPGTISWEAWARKRAQSQCQQSDKPSSIDHSFQIDTVEGRLIGWIWISIYPPDADTDQVELGIGLPEEDTWGQGYGTEAMCLIIDHLFQEMGVTEVRTNTWVGNARMMRVAQKCGFQEAARSPHAAGVTIRGELVVIVNLALTRVRWLAQKGQNR